MRFFCRQTSRKDFAAVTKMSVISHLQNSSGPKFRLLDTGKENVEKL